MFCFLGKAKRNPFKPPSPISPSQIPPCQSFPLQTLVIVDAGLMCPRPMCPRPKNSWMLRPLNKASLVSLTDVSRPWTASSMELAPFAAIAASVGLRLLMDQWGVWPALPTPLTRFIELAPLRRMNARPTHRTPPLRSAKARDSWKSGVA
jgi:hypothetical protein